MTARRTNRVLKRSPSAFGRNLRATRIAANLSQDELAAKSGVAKMSISHYETGFKQNANAPNLVKLADALGVTVDSLLTAESGS